MVVSRSTKLTGYVYIKRILIFLLVILPFRAVQTLIGFGTSPSAIHLIGFSLGAHFSAYVAKNITGIGRLTGKYIQFMFSVTSAK
jgi:hypothetical protein